MSRLNPTASQWLSDVLGLPFTATKHAYSNQDEVYKIVTSECTYYLKAASALTAERDNLQKLENVLQAPKVIDFYSTGGSDFLLISELAGKNLVELIGEWDTLQIVDIFAEAVRELHSINVTTVFPEAGASDVLLHGDMAMPNIIISEEHKIGYIDFGQLAFGLPELDVADGIWSLQRNIGPDYGELFLEKYGPVPRSTKIEEALKFRHAGK